MEYAFGEVDVTRGGGGLELIHVLQQAWTLYRAADSATYYREKPKNAYYLLFLRHS